MIENHPQQHDGGGRGKWIGMECDQDIADKETQGACIDREKGECQATERIYCPHPLGYFNRGAWQEITANFENNRKREGLIAQDDEDLGKIFHEDIW